MGDVAMISTYEISNTTWIGIGNWELTSCVLKKNIALEWRPEDLSHGKSTLVQLMTWFYQATSRFLHKCWPRSPTLYGVTGRNEGNLYTGHFNTLLLLQYEIVIHWSASPKCNLSWFLSILLPYSLPIMHKWMSYKIESYALLLSYYQILTS